ncbi:MAG: hypothetical protein WB471_15090 [Nocardioides sp.]
MYDLYPEWGPAKHRSDDDRIGTVDPRAVQTALDLRDNGGQRPDDN